MLLFSQNKLFKDLTTNIGFQLLAWVILTSIAFGKINTPGPTEHVLMSLITLILIMGQMSSKSRIINLDNKLFDFLGKISYGLYVIHPFIIILLSKAFVRLNINISIKKIIIFSTVIFSTILIAHLSYKYYERPFLKLKRQLAIVKSQSSKYL